MNISRRNYLRISTGVVCAAGQVGTFAHYLPALVLLQEAA